MKQNNNKILIGGIGLLVIGTGVYLYRDKLFKSKSQPEPSKDNLDHLNSLHPKYKPLFFAFINEAKRQGWTPQINASYRTFKRSQELKKEDSRNATPGFSPHNYGMAIDVQFSKNGKVLGKNTPTQDWLLSRLPSIADKYGLAWGGLIKGYPDRVHFYVKGIDTKKLYAMALKQFNTNDPNQIQGNRLNIA